MTKRAHSRALSLGRWTGCGMIAGLTGVSLTVFSLVSCKSRTYQQDFAKTKRVPGDAALAALLKDGNARITNNPPNDYRSDRLNRQPDGSTQGAFGYYEGPGKPQILQDVSWLVIPRMYIALLFKGEDRRPVLPIRLAAETVLEYMELHRSIMNNSAPTSYQRPAWVQKAIDKKPDGEKTEFASIYERETENIVDNGFVSACLGNQVPHWSDITFHFYCQLGYARSCYTDNVRTLSGDRQQIQDEEKRLEALSTVRSEVIAACAVPYNAPPNPNPSATFTVDDATTRWWFAREYRIFDVFDENGDPVMENGVQLNIFNYIMLSQTYAFDWTQQQAVINAFYGRSASPPRDSLEDPSDCNSLRPTAYEMENPQSNESPDKCDPAKVRKLPLAALGY